MSNISEHNTELKREHTNTENTRVDFLISGHTIGVNDVLESSSEFIGFEVSGRVSVSDVFGSDGGLG